MENNHNIHDLLKHILDDEELIHATFSGVRAAGVIGKIDVRPLLIKEKLLYQVTEYKGPQAFHRNLSPQDCLALFRRSIADFKQTYLYTKEADYHILIGKKGQATLLKKKPTRAPKQSAHNRKKEYLLPEGKPVPFLIGLGVMNQEGKVYPAKQDKFRQINRFVEMIDDILIHFEPSKPLRVVDFGCGKAYLTFALFHYLKETKGYPVDMVGIDLKEEVIRHCRELAIQLDCADHLHFVQGDIEQYQQDKGTDLVVSLHACNTATDAALAKAVKWSAKVILSVPCCQHELMHQIQNEALRPLLKHGIMRERFAALATDAARAQLLEVVGYQTQVIEFIEVEHTPKNLLIRAIKHPKTDGQRTAAWKEYLFFKKMLSITPSLESSIILPAES